MWCRHSADSKIVGVLACKVIPNDKYNRLRYQFYTLNLKCSKYKTVFDLSIFISKLGSLV